MINPSGQLTQYPEGSVQELWTISYPLILSFFSINIMIFIDRLILAKYDTQTMNAAVVAGMVFSIFQYGAIGIASISEVFVGQYNGAKKYNRIGEPVWQMIWFSLMTAFVFILLALFAAPYLISNPAYITEGVPFFKTLMWFGPAFPLAAALGSFFVGQGRVKLVMVTIILSNILNVLLDFLLIYGVKNILSPLGATGAAYATGIAQTVQAFALLWVFLQPKNREDFGTHQWRFKPTLFLKMLKTGLPTSLSGITDALAWGVLAQLLASVSEGHITIFSIGDSFFWLFGFGFWGLQKGITTLAANYIGANREELLSQAIWSGIKIILPIMLLLAIPMFIFPEKLTTLFLNQDASLLWNDEMKGHVEIVIRWLWVYFLFDAIAWLFCGVLTASGDTRFVMLMSSLTPWAFSVIPAYILVVHFDGSPIVSWVLFAIYGLLNVASYFLRYKTRPWGAAQPLHTLTS